MQSKAMAQRALARGLLLLPLLAFPLAAQSAPLPGRAISWWSAEGNAHDRFGLSHGVLANGATFAPGVVGQAFDLDGTNDYVRVANAGGSYDFYLTDSFSFECWFRSADSGRLQAILAKEDGNRPTFASNLLADGKVSSAIQPSEGGTYSVQSAAAYADGQFHHLATVVDRVAGTLTLYVDGGFEVVTAPLPAGTLVEQPTALLIGARLPAAPDRFFRGRIDEVAIYAGALSLAEVAAIFAAGANGKTASPLPPSAGRVATAVANVFVPVGFGAAVFRSGGLPQELALEASGNVLVASNCSTCGLSRLSPDGVLLATSTAAADPDGVAVDATGRILLAGGTQIRIVRSLDGGTDSVLAGGFTNLNFVAADAAGMVYAVENSGAIRRVTAAGQILPGNLAVLAAWPFIEITRTDELLATNAGTLVRIDKTTGQVTALTATADLNGGIVQGPGAPFGHDLFVACQFSGRVVRVTPDGAAATFLTMPQRPLDLLFDSRGDLLITDSVVTNRILRIFPLDRPPIADAGADLTADERTVVRLDGSGSRDPEAQPLSFSWMQLAGPAVILDATDPVRPAFVAPAVTAGGAVLTFQLVVSDGPNASEPDVVNVTVRDVNQPPVAHAGEDQQVGEGAVVTLDGAQSYDPDNDPLSFAWAQTAGPPVTLAGADRAQPSFVAPVVGPAGADLAFRLTVDDGHANSTDDVLVRVVNVNQKPVAAAGPAQTRNENTPVTLDGSGSSDPDGDPLWYHWEQTGGMPVLLSDEWAVAPQFQAPVVGAGGETLTFALTVFDGALASDPDTVAITVVDVNAPPRCDLARPSAAVLWPPNHRLEPVAVLGLSDPDGDAVTITILSVTQDEPVRGPGAGDVAPDAVLVGNGVLLRAERNGGGNGRFYVVRFRATDLLGQSCVGSVTVVVPHDHKRNEVPVDDGQLYDSLQVQ